MAAVKIAELVSNRLDALIGPVLEAGDSSMLDEFSGTVTILSSYTQSGTVGNATLGSSEKGEKLVE